MVGLERSHNCQAPQAVYERDGSSACCRSSITLWKRLVAQLDRSSSTAVSRGNTTAAGEFRVGEKKASDEMGRQSRGYKSETKTSPCEDVTPQRGLITTPLYLGKYEVTNGQFKQCVKDTDNTTEAENGPVGRKGKPGG